MKYTDVAYAYNRMERTFFLHNGNLVLVTGWDDGEKKLRLQYKDGRRYYAKVENLDLTPVPLGYINHSDTCCFSSRMPMRRDWKQGLRPNNFVMYSLYPELNMEVHEITRLYDIEDTCLNRYPSFRKCVDYVEETHRASAFSRCFAVNEDGNLTYKGAKIVGKIEDERSITLEKKSTHLKEFLEESLRNPRNPDEIVVVRT